MATSRATEPACRRHGTALVTAMETGALFCPACRRADRREILALIAGARAEAARADAILTAAAQAEERP